MFCQHHTNHRWLYFDFFLLEIETAKIIKYVTLLYFVTLLFCPLHQSGKDLSLLLKLSKVGALTTADGKSFQ